MRTPPRIIGSSCTSRRRLSAIVLTSFLVSASACSSGSDSAQPTTTAGSTTTVASGPLTEDEWRSEANAICAETAPTIGAAFAAMDPESPTDQQIDNVLSALVSVNRETEQRIAALEAPPSIADKAKALLDANEAVTAQIEQQGPAILDTLDSVFAPVNQMAADLGLDACAG